MNELSKEKAQSAIEALMRHPTAYFGEAEAQEVARWLSELLALRERAEPVYQCMEDGNWYDTEKRLYDEAKESGNICRVLYTAPPAPVELTVWYGSMPESNGKTNWTAILHRKGEPLFNGITIECSEYPDRVRYEADRMRYLIGELAERPLILNYDAAKHSGYVAPKAAPVAVPDENGLLPCPCCGGNADFDYDDDNLNWISCSVCGVSTDTAYHTDVDARDKLREVWNCRAAMLQGAESASQQTSDEHVRREYRMEGSIWVQCSKQEYDRKKAAGREVRELYERPQNAQQNTPTLREAVTAIRNSGIAIDANKIQAERDALNALDVPDGLARVPKRPTREMLQQIHPIAETTCPDCGKLVTVDCEDNVLMSWDDMLAAAPAPGKGG